MSANKSPIEAKKHLYQEKDIYAHYSNPDRSIDENQPEVFLNELGYLDKYLKPGAHVLVLGCAGGQESFAMLRHGYHVTGLDIVPEYIDIIRKYAAQKGFSERSRFEIVNGYEWPMIPDQSIDAVSMFANFISVAGISHEIRIKLFNEAYRVLKPGGVIFAEGSDCNHPIVKQRTEAWRPKLSENLELKKQWGLTAEENTTVLNAHQCAGDRASLTTHANYDMEAKQVWSELAAAGLRVVNILFDENFYSEYPSVLCIAVKDPYKRMP